MTVTGLVSYPLDLIGHCILALVCKFNYKVLKRSLTLMHHPASKMHTYYHWSKT